MTPSIFRPPKQLSSEQEGLGVLGIDGDTGLDSSKPEQQGIPGCSRIACLGSFPCTRVLLSSSGPDLSPNLCAHRLHLFRHPAIPLFCPIGCMYVHTVHTLHREVCTLYKTRGFLQDKGIRRCARVQEHNSHGRLHITRRC
jgi:hypothetical protein